MNDPAAPKMRMVIETPAQAKDPIAYWAECVSRSYRAGIEQFVTTGHALEHAVSDFQKRDDMHWKHAYSELLQRVKMSRQVATQLRSIAKHPVLSDRRNYHMLPANWTTLSDISFLPEAEVRKRLACGDLTAATKGAEVRGWQKSNRPKSVGSIDQIAKDWATTTPASFSKGPAQPALDAAHAEYLKLDAQTFISEIVNLIQDHPNVSALDVIAALGSQQ